MNKSLLFVLILALICVGRVYTNKTHLTHNQHKHKFHQIHQQELIQASETVASELTATDGEADGETADSQQEAAATEADGEADGENSEISAIVETEAQADGESFDLFADEQAAAILNLDGENTFIFEYDGETSHLPQRTSPSEMYFMAANYTSFDEFYAAFQQKLDDDLAVLNAEYTSKSQECSTYPDKIAKAEYDTEKYTNYINFITERISNNTAKIDKVFQERCDQHQVFIEYYKNAKITLRLTAFLKEAVANYSAIQLKQVGKILTQFMEPSFLSNSKAVKVMLNQLKEIDGKFDEVGDSLDNETRQRTDEQIGTDHIDDGRDQIEVDTFESSKRRRIDDYKEEIRKILEEIEEKTKKEIQRRQNDEIDLNDKIVKFVERIERENAYLTEERTQLNEQLQETLNEINVLTYMEETCHAELKWLLIEIEAQTIIIQEYVEQKDVIETEYKEIMDAGKPDETDGGQDDGEDDGEAAEEDAGLDVDTTNWNPETDDGFNLDDFNPKKGIQIPDAALSGLQMGLSWAANGIDLDSGVIMTEASGKLINTIFWDNKVSEDGCVSLDQDNQEGSDDGDAETLTFKLNDCAANVESLYLSINIYDNALRFKGVDYAKVTIYIDSNVFLEHQFKTTSEYSHSASGFLFVEVYRLGDKWYLRPVSVFTYANTDGDPLKDCEYLANSQLVSAYQNGQYENNEDYSKWTVDQGQQYVQYKSPKTILPTSYNQMSVTLSQVPDDKNESSGYSYLSYNFKGELVDKFNGVKSTAGIIVDHTLEDYTSADGSISIVQPADQTSDVQTINIDLSLVDSSVERLVFFSAGGINGYNNFNGQNVQIDYEGQTFISSPMIYRYKGDYERAQTNPSTVLFSIYRESPEGPWQLRLTNSQSIQIKDIDMLLMAVPVENIKAAFDEQVY